MNATQRGYTWNFLIGLFLRKPYWQQKDQPNPSWNRHQIMTTSSPWILELLPSHWLGSATLLGRGLLLYHYFWHRSSRQIWCLCEHQEMCGQMLWRIWKVPPILFIVWTNTPIPPLIPLARPKSKRTSLCSCMASWLSYWECWSPRKTWYVLLVPTWHLWHQQDPFLGFHIESNRTVY